MALSKAELNNLNSDNPTSNEISVQLLTSSISMSSAYNTKNKDLIEPLLPKEPKTSDT